MLVMSVVAPEFMSVRRNANVCDRANRAWAVRIARPAACCSADFDLFYTTCCCFYD